MGEVRNAYRILPENPKDFLEEVGTNKNIKIDLNSKLDLFGSHKAQ
jgi:hypothetical protein